MNETAPELALEASQDVLTALVALLPSQVIQLRQKGFSYPVVPSIAREIISNALAKGHIVDRSNGDSPIADWDGWLTIDTPDGVTQLQTDREKWSRLIGNS